MRKCHPINVWLAVLGCVAFGEVKAGELLWPIPEPLHQRTYVSNYVDENPSQGFLDYACGTDHGYDGHSGLDIAALDFRVADQGVPIVAVADGVVDAVRFDQFDRNRAEPYQGFGNGVWLRHDDGRYTMYWHMRENSVPVAIGERVIAGQLLGYVASSGSSPIPHLHFQLNRTRTNADKLPQFAGQCGLAESVFANQPDYVGSARLRVLALGLHSEASVPDGIYQFGDLAPIKQGLPELDTIGRGETELPFFVQIQGNAGQRLEVEWIDPDGEVQARRAVVLSVKRRYGWYVGRFSGVTLDSDGEWLLRVADDQGELARQIVRVGPATVRPPRFYPLAGRSLRLNGQEQSFRPERLASSGTILEMEGAPEGVRLDGDRVVVPAATFTAQRNTQFAVIARDTATGLQDVFHVQLVNPSANSAEMPLDAESSGFYFAADQSGQGLAIEVNEATGFVFLAWFTYNLPLRPQDPPQWLVASGNYQGAFATLDAAITEGGEFDRPTPVTTSEPGSVGSVRLHRQNCNDLNVTYDWGPGREGFIAMRRALPVNCLTGPSDQ